MQRPSTAPTLPAVAAVGSAPVDATACALAFSDPNSTNVLSILQQVHTQFKTPESHIAISKHHTQPPTVFRLLTNTLPPLRCPFQLQQGTRHFRDT